MLVDGDGGMILPDILKLVRLPARHAALMREEKIIRMRKSVDVIIICKGSHYESSPLASPMQRERRYALKSVQLNRSNASSLPPSDDLIKILPHPLSNVPRALATVCLSTFTRRREGVS